MQPWEAPSPSAPAVVWSGYGGGRSGGEGETTAATSATAPAPASTHGQAAGGGRQSEGRPYDGRQRWRSWRPRRARAPAGQRARAPAGQRARAPAGQRARAPAGQRARAPAGQRARAPAGRRARAPAGRRTRAPAGRRTRAPAGRRTRARRGGGRDGGCRPAGSDDPVPRSTGRGRVTGARVGCLAARPEAVTSVPIPESNLDRSSGPPASHQWSTA